MICFFGQVCLLLATIACNSGKENHPVNERSNPPSSIAALVPVFDTPPVDSAFESHKRIFKKWVADTLRMLRPSLKGPVKTKDPVRKEAVLYPDSMGLSILIHYHLNPQAVELWRSSDVDYLLRVLRMEDELPKGPFALKFSANYQYIIPPVSGFAYELKYNLDGVQVITKKGKEVSEYYIDRASIKDKKTTSIP